MMEGFRLPDDPQADEPDEMKPDTLPIDDMERPHPSADEVAHEQGVRPDYVKRRAAEQGDLGDQQDVEDVDRP